MAVRENAKARPRVVPKDVPVKPAPETVLVAMTELSEGERIWNHLTRGFRGIFGLAQEYINVNVPGDPLPAFLEVRAACDNIIEQLQRRKLNESANPTAQGSEE